MLFLFVLRIIEFFASLMLEDPILVSRIPTYKLIDAAVNAIQGARSTIAGALERDPEFRYNRTTTNRRGCKSKEALVLDLIAEEGCRQEFGKRFGNEVMVLGEETLSAGLMPRDKVCALVDMIDGTDLLEMGVPLWCSAIILFDARIPKILGATIGLATGEIYFAQDGEDAAVYRRPTDSRDGSKADPLAGPSDVTLPKHARVCFYGQKPKNFFGLMNIEEFKKAIGRFAAMEANKEQVDFRIYNFAGNPAMVKLVDRLKDADGNLLDRGFDAVFDVVGQRPHDVIPGAYIAKRANAHLCNLKGVEITDDDLAERLCNPNERMTYMLASNSELAAGLLPMLQANS